MQRINLVAQLFFHAVVRHPYQVFLVTAIITFLCITQIVDIRTGTPKVEIDPSIESLLPTESEDRDYYEHVKTLFNGGGTIIIALKDERDIFTTSNLEKIQAISDELAGLDMVNRVSSLSTALNIRSENSDLVIQPFFTDAPANPEGLADVKKRALSDPIYAGNLVTADGKVAVIVVHLLDVEEKVLLESAIDERITAITEKHWSHGETWITGGAHIKSRLTKIMMKDMVTVVPLAMVIMALVSFISYRSIRGVLIPMIVVGISVILSVAFIAIQYKTLNQVSFACPSIVLVVGYSYVIHVLSTYYDALRLQVVPEGENPTPFVIKDIIGPVFWTGITTAIGFFSLATSSLSAIQQFGISTGIGVCITMLVSVTLAPAILQALPLPKKIPESASNSRIDQYFEKIAKFDTRNAKAIYLINIVIAILCLAALPRIETGTDLIHSFKPDSDVRRNFDAVNKNLGSANSFEIVMETSVPFAFNDPANLKAIEDLQRWLKKQPGIGGSTSLVDYIKVIHKGVTGDENNFTIPPDALVIGQLLEIAGNAELADYVTSDYQKTRIIVRTTATNSTAVAGIIAQVQNYLDKQVPSHLSPRVTGNSYLISLTMDRIAIGQVQSVASAFIIIFFVLAIIFTSFKAGFIAMLPNLMPVLIFFGILGYTGISLNVSTSLIACIVIGIAVDDTIHIFARFNKLAKQTANTDTGIILAMKTVGRPITYSTIALCAGFSCLGFSEMQTQIEFGILAAVTLLLGWISDITLTPAIASKLKIVTLWELLSLNLGENPTKSIPFFSGLTPQQARITALMAKIQEYPAGTLIFRAGDTGDNMYVVIDGQLSVTLDGENAKVIHLKDISRGDLIGEVALYHGARTANVTATTDVRLLEITKADLQGIQKARPKIAAQLYANLNKIFADRFANLTARVTI